MNDSVNWEANSGLVDPDLVPSILEDACSTSDAYEVCVDGTGTGASRSSCIRLLFFFFVHNTLLGSLQSLLGLFKVDNVPNSLEVLTVSRVSRVPDRLSLTSGLTFLY